VSGQNIGGRREADDGAADPGVAAVLSAYAAGQAAEQAVLAALSGTRLLVPLVERAADSAADPCGHAHPDGPADSCGPARAGDPADPGARESQGATEMASPRLIGNDGRPAVLAFTSLDALRSWRPDARPVPSPAAEVWSTAAGESCAVVIDVAGPVPVAVDGTRLAALSSGGPLPEPHTDPDVQALVMEAIAGEPAIAGAELAEGPEGTDLTVHLIFRPGGGPGGPGRGPGRGEAETAVRRAAEAIGARLAGRLRRGIQIAAAPGPGVTR
jgi:hypothetical protein